jgi:IS30 family transposase
MREGRGVKPSARAAGIGKETGFRWLRESFVALREQGVPIVEAQARLGYPSQRVLLWEEQRLARAGEDGRHHLAVALDVEQAFWAAFEAGLSIDQARRVARMGRSTAYRSWRRRFIAMRQGGSSVSAAARTLRVPRARAAAWEADRKQANDLARRDLGNAERRAVRESARHVELLMQPRSRSKTEEREQRYWQLMRQGMTNTAACKLLGVNRRTGGLIRQRHRHQTAALAAEQRLSGRYLSLPERLQIADLIALGLSMRAVAAELGRSPSTIKRELDRHRDPQGRYLPRGADHSARLARRRPRAHKLVTNRPLRQVVQRKLNRCWSPDEISGWLRLTHPDDSSMQLCPETIYRSLLVPGGQGLHKRYCRRLRTGRRIRKSRWLTRNGHGCTVRNMTMIDQRPAEVETKQQAGRPLGRRSHRRYRQCVGNDDAAGTQNPLRHHRQPSSRSHRELRQRRRDRRVRHDASPHETNPDLGSGRGDGPTSGPRHRDRHQDLLRRTLRPLAARRERELQRPGPPILPQRHRPVRPHGRARRHGDA